MLPTEKPWSDFYVAWVLSTDFHVRQGELELEAQHWDEATPPLAVRLRRAPGEGGRLCVICPEGFADRHGDRGRIIAAKSAVDLSLLIRKDIKFESEFFDCRFEFERYDTAVISVKR